MTAVELLEAGYCVQIERLARAGGRWCTIRFPALVAVLRHPDGGVTLYDTGYAPRFHDATAGLPYRLYAMLLPVTCNPEDAAVDQLRRRGITADEVRTVVLSHLHADHLAGLRDFPDARIVVGPHALPPGWRQASPWRHVTHGFVPALLPDDLDDRTVGVETLPVVPTGLGGRLRNGHDLLGDGSALAIPLPGHAEGHLGLWIPGAGPDGLLLAGDACWHRRAFTDGELPAGVVRGRMDDAGAYRAVIDELARLHRERPALLIVPSHCEASIDQAREVLHG